MIDTYKTQIDFVDSAIKTDYWTSFYKEFGSNDRYFLPDGKINKAWRYYAARAEFYRELENKALNALTIDEQKEAYEIYKAVKNVRETTIEQLDGIAELVS
jgi:hypothetical protein